MSFYIYFLCTGFWTLYIFLPCCWFFLFLRALYIVPVIWVKIFFPIWLCVCFDSLRWWLCPLKVFLILCNRIYLSVYSVCILSQNRKDISYFRFLSPSGTLSFHLFYLHLGSCDVYSGMFWELEPTLCFYVFSILSCPNTIYWKACIFPRVS